MFHDFILSDFILIPITLFRLQKKIVPTNFTFEPGDGKYDQYLMTARSKSSANAMLKIEHYLKEKAFIRYNIKKYSSKYINARDN